MNDYVGSKWRIPDGYEILSRPFGDQFVVYHCGSGDTHLLDQVSFCVLNELNGHVCSYEQLLEKITDQIEFELPEQSQKYLNDLISEFQKLSIIERINT
jgi:PqqD family protein of HPr-rel-A system